MPCTAAIRRPGLPTFRAGAGGARVGWSYTMVVTSGVRGASRVPDRHRGCFPWSMDTLFDVDWHKLFVPKLSVLEMLIRGAGMYLALILLLRAIPKRQVGQ